MSTIITRGFGQAKQGLITRGYGRSLEEAIVAAIEEVTGVKTKRKGRSRQGKLRRDEEYGIEHYTLEVSLSRINDTNIEQPIKNKILESIEKNDSLRMKVSSVNVVSETTEDDTKITVTATIKRKKKNAD